MSNQSFQAPLSVKAVKFLLDAAWYLSFVAAALSLVIIIVALVGFEPQGLQIGSPLKITWEADDQAADIPFDERPMITEIKGQARVLIDPRDNYWKYMVIIFIPLSLAAMMFSIKQLRSFFKNLKQGDPFHPENPKYLRHVAFVTIAAGPVTGLGVLIQSSFFFRALQIPGGKFDLYFNIFPEFIFLGLILLAIAQAFEVAVRMKQEQDLTI